MGTKTLMFHVMKLLAMKAVYTTENLGAGLTDGASAKEMIAH